MSARGESIPDEAPDNNVVRRRLLAGVGITGVAAVGAQLAAPEASAAPSRTDLVYYWESQQKSLGYSQGVRVDNTVWLSGTAALDKDFNCVSPGDLPAQMAFIYARIKESLARYSLDLRHVVRESMYVTDMDALVGALPYRKRMYADGPFPTSTTVQVNQLIVPGLMIEIEVVASRVPA
ncbi:MULTISPECIES: RidA family protein [unclassified Streptomyces]|uniref:RidA family protein n=1 Tax=unclassified Streptomyces TaxID=2593676 RepID=UPI0036E47763